MADMFGAPLGISAAEDQINQNALAGLKAQQALGEIAKQPGEMALTAAQARLAGAHTQLYGAQAKEAEAKLRDLEEMQKFEAGFKARGTLATVGDLDAAGKPKSLSTPYLELLDAADKAGMPLRLTSPLREKAALVFQREAAAGHSQASEELQKLKKSEEVATQIASYAQAALENPGNYDQIRLAAQEAGLPINRLPPTFNRAVVESFRDFGIKALDKMKEKRASLADKDKERLHASMMGRNSASAALAKERTRLATQRYDNIVKNDGETSSAAVAAKQSMEKRREVLNFKDLDARYPQAPTNPSARVLKQEYRTKSGQLFRWEKDAQGNTGAVPIATPKGLEAIVKKAAARAAPVAEPADDDEEDE